MRQIHSGTWGGYVTHRPTTTLMIDGGTWGDTSGGKWGGYVLVLTPECMPRKGGVYKAHRLPVPPPCAAAIEQE